MKKLLIAVAALSLAAPALAKDKDPVFVISNVIKDKPGPVAIAPQMAYVMMRSDAAMPLYIMKVPSAEDQVAYDKMRADALVKAHGKYVKKLKEYDAAVKTNADLPKGAPRAALPDKPVEPTEANFEFTPFPLLAGVSIGPLNRFAKGGAADLSTYLQELTPGEYRIYGPISVMPGAGAMGSCFCMGSVSFTAKAGEVTDIGVVDVNYTEPVKRPEGDSSAPVVRNGQFLVATRMGATIDPRLAGATVVPAKFKPVGKLPNYFGMTIARMPAMPGVMRYDRDRVVDLTTGN